jgi:cytochrome P450
LPIAILTIKSAGWHEGRDKKVWNEGPVNGELRDVEDFWAERFLVYPNDPNSGPRKPSAISKPKSQKSDTGNQPKFTADPVNGSFIPYGGGAKICPGRFYAKQESLGAMALFLTMFDIELKEKKKLPVPNMMFFPFGVIPPKGEFPARIRRRKVQS